MTKQDIIDHLTYNCGLHRSSAIEAVNGTINCISKALVEGNDVTLRGFGTFKSINVAEKVGRNITAGTQMVIPAHRSVKLVLSKELKDQLNS